MASCNDFDLSVLNRRDGFSSFIGVRVASVAEDGSAEGELPIAPHTLNPAGIVHGGCLASLADTVAGVAVFRATGHMCVTVNYSLSFLSPARGTGARIRCRATPEKLGRTLCVYHVSLTDDGGTEVAAGTFTFFSRDYGNPSK